VLLSDNTVQALCERGLMPLVSRRDRNAARLLRWQSLAEPPTALRGLAG
jgi:type VI secretion system protein ImpC